MAAVEGMAAVEEVMDDGPQVEARVSVRAAAGMGLGVFAEEPLPAGTWVGDYKGALTTREELLRRYNVDSVVQASLLSDYLADVGSGVSIDATNSSHFSRYINHAEHGNLEAFFDEENRRVDFYAARSIGVGEEVAYDYGPRYWKFRPQPLNDSRNFSEPRFRVRQPGLSLLHPPRLGTRLPITPLTGQELQAALALPEAESRAALLRSLEYFGATRLEDGTLDVCFGVGPDAERQSVPQAELSYGALQRATTACIVQAVIDPADASGAASSEFVAWLGAAEDELRLIRGWRKRMPRFASARHDAVGLAAYLLWKNPGGHEVCCPLDRKLCNELLLEVAEQSNDESGLEPVLEKLGRHAAQQHVASLVDMLQEWIVLGDGCRVASHGPPSLTGVMSSDVRAVWSRVPQLSELGLL